MERARLRWHRFIEVPFLLSRPRPRGSRYIGGPQAVEVWDGEAATVRLVLDIFASSFDDLDLLKMLLREQVAASLSVLNLSWHTENKEARKTEKVPPGLQDSRKSDWLHVEKVAPKGRKFVAQHLSFGLW
eukprot:1016712-Amphidinium_carterae.1